MTTLSASRGLRWAARVLAELACIVLFVAMVWTWAALGAGA
jgi:hypothetical protein